MTNEPAAKPYTLTVSEPVWVTDGPLRGHCETRVTTTSYATEAELVAELDAYGVPRRCRARGEWTYRGWAWSWAATKPALPEHGPSVDERTPVQIDTELAELHRARALAERALSWATKAMFKPAGSVETRVPSDRRGRYEYRQSMTADECIAALVDRRDNHGDELAEGTGYHWNHIAGRRTRPSDLLDGHAARWAELEVILAQITELNVEYARRPWSRFFLVTSSAGHIHSSMDCSTCRPGRTTFGWMPEMSGVTEAEAIAHLGKHSDALCSVCFPTAPVATKRTNITKAQAVKMAHGGAS